MPQLFSPGTNTEEIDQSDIIPTLMSSIGSIVIQSNRGPLVPTLFQNNQQILARIGGKPSHFSHYAALDFLKQSSFLFVVRALNDDDSTLYGGLNVVVDPGPNTAFGSGTATPTEDAFSAGQLFRVYGADPGVWNNGLSITLDPTGFDISGDPNENTFQILVYEDNEVGTPVLMETFRVSRDVDGKNGFGQNNYIENVINNQSAFIKVKNNTAEAFDALPTVQVANLDFVGGVNGTAPVAADIANTWDANFSNKDEIRVTILINGGFANTTVQNKLIDIAELRRDCVAFLDIPPDLSNAGPGAGSEVDYVKNDLAPDTSFAAIYEPWAYDYDTVNDKKVLVPPSGHASAVVAFTDRNAEPWFAPAGKRRGRIDAIDVQYKRTLAERDILYPERINTLRFISGEGIFIWGNRTLQRKESALASINVRRLLNVMEESILIFLENQVFEFNDEITRAQITEVTTGFLSQIKAKRGLIDFRVVCDESNNTSLIIDQRKLICDIYVKPARAAEFITLRVIITRTGASFEEIISSGVLA